MPDTIPYMATILIVDDEKDVATLLRFLLEKDGHKIEEAYDGLEALVRLGVEAAPDGGAAEVVRPDIIILDIMMPVMDGYTVNMRLQSHESTRSIPVLVLTAKGNMKDLFEVAPNVVAYVEKPFDPKSLRDRVQSILANHSSP